MIFLTMIGPVFVVKHIMGTATGEIHEFQEGVDTITISKSGKLSDGCSFRMGRRADGEEDVFCCYGDQCDPDEQSVECREEADYSVEKNITSGTFGECILELKGKARMDDAGTYRAVFLGKWHSNKPFKINVKKAMQAGLHPVMIASLGSLLFIVFVFVVLWKIRKNRLENSRDDATNMVELNNGV